MLEIKDRRVLPDRRRFVDEYTREYVTLRRIEDRKQARAIRMRRLGDIGELEIKMAKGYEG